MQGTPPPSKGELHSTRIHLALGPCYLAWTSHGLHELRLEAMPSSGLEGSLKRALEASLEGSQDHFLIASPGKDSSCQEPLDAPVFPVWLPTLVERCHDLLRGKPVGFDDIPLDLQGIAPFHQRVYAALRKVGPGQVVTYQQLAERAGSPQGARAVGQAVGHNRHLLVIPCHRVVASGGRLGGFSAPGGAVTKRLLLDVEGGGSFPKASAAQKPPRANLEALARHQEPAKLWEPGMLTKAQTHLARHDPKLARLMESLGPCTLEPTLGRPAFAALCEAIIYQQLAGTAARAIAERFWRLAAPEVEHAPRFPTPEEVLAASPEALRQVGLSGGKQATLRALAQAVVEGTCKLDELKEESDARVFSELTRIRGIGPWTCQMLMMFTWGRTDLLPAGDLGIRKAIARLDALPSLPTPQQVTERGQAWMPYRTVASWYLWKSLGGVTMGNDPASAKTSL